MDTPNRNTVLRVIFISLLLDLISFTFILPLFPQLLDFYRQLEAQQVQPDSPAPATVLTRILQAVNAYKQSFARPISDRYDIVLLGGALGSLFSLCQALAAPVIGRLSDQYGRRTALLWSMLGNIASVALWLAAVDFRTFLASRIVGGLSEGNVQMAAAIAADVSDEHNRGATMAIVGACFSIAFTFGPALGAALSRVQLFAANPFAAAAGFSLFLIVVETIYLYLCLPETHPSSTKRPATGQTTSKGTDATPKSHPQTNSHFLLNLTHFAFILVFSGMEFSLPFMTYDLFSYGSAKSGRLLGFVGLIAALLQGGVTRRLHPLRVVQLGVSAATASFFLLAQLTSERALYGAATLLAATTATVVTGLNSLSSLEAAAGERGGKLGNHRSWGGFSFLVMDRCSFDALTIAGQVGRAMGPILFCTLYWWAGRTLAYQIGGVAMLGVAGLVFGGLKAPASLQPRQRLAAPRSETKDGK